MGRLMTAYACKAEREERLMKMDRRLKGRAANEGLALQLAYKKLQQEEAQVQISSLLLQGAKILDI